MTILASMQSSADDRSHGTGETPTGDAETGAGVAVDRFESFADFWPYYLGEHTSPGCRRVHYLGSLGALAALAAGVALHPLWLVAVPLAGYGAAWIGHFTIEHNRPATWSYVWWSLVADGRMFVLAATGRLRAEFDRYGVPFDGR
jgi:hypothetical protein